MTPNRSSQSQNNALLFTINELGKLVHKNLSDDSLLSSQSSLNSDPFKIVSFSVVDTPILKGKNEALSSRYNSSLNNIYLSRTDKSSTVNDFGNPIVSTPQLPSAKKLEIKPYVITDFGNPIVSTPQLPSAKKLKIKPFAITDFGNPIVSTPQLLTAKKLKIKPFAITDFGNPIVSTSQGRLSAPVSYDLRTLGLVTPIKDQGNCGSCWTFGTYASLESSILKTGRSTQDFSENHLKNYHGFDWGPCDGGNDLISSAYLSRGDGPVDEKDDPYHDYDDRPSPGGIPRYYVGQTLWFDTDTEIKESVMNLGALTTSMYWDDNFFNNTTDTYYYSGTQGTNHCIAIIGWDDNKVVSGTTVKGAWLIKNSWGNSWGDQGYFWISYADSRGANRGVSFSQATSPYKSVYDYDDFGFVQSWSSPYGFNAYTPNSNESLKAVGFYTLTDSASYEIKIFDDFQNGKLTNLLSSTTGTALFQGYHAVDLSSDVPLKKGDKFYVSLHLSSGGEYPLASDGRISGYSSNCTANPGESYWSFDGSTWSDLNPYDPTANFSIKALVGTSGVTTPTLAIAATNANQTEGNSGTKAFTFTVNRSVNTTGTNAVSWAVTGSGTNPANATDFAGGVLPSGIVSFAVGEPSKMITVNVQGDTTVEQNENFTVTLSNPTNGATITTATATGTIQNDDSSTLSTIALASNYSGVSENGKTNLIYTFNRTTPTTNPLTVNFSIGGTATRGTDYVAYGGTFPTPTQGTITFAAGATTAQLAMVTSGDTTKETNETISLSLTTGAGYTIGTSTPVITTIINDDGTMNQKGTLGNDLIEAGLTRILSGKAGNDILIGSNADDILSGGLGSDTLTSGAGFDTFLFSSKSEGIDIFTDFNVNQDIIQVSGTSFGGGLVAGESISASQLSFSLGAVTATTRFIFDKPTGKLYFDIDGNGSNAPVQLASLTANLGFTEDNIFVA
jgi:C1A family cysteine protease